MNSPNLLTLFRIVAVIPIAIIIDQKNVGLYPLAFIIIFFAFLSDLVDGVLARKLKKESLFGARFDIVGDRVLELSLWLIFCSAGIFPSIMGVIFIARGLLTDAIRENSLLKNRLAPFDMSLGKIGSLLVAGRFSRGLYGVIKLSAFLLAMITLYSKTLFPEQYQTLLSVTIFLGWLTVIYNMVRGLPVILQGKDCFWEKKG